MLHETRSGKWAGGQRGLCLQHAWVCGTACAMINIHSHPSSSGGRG